jgi:transglutaminase-like putative cysteine protease
MTETTISTSKPSPPPASVPPPNGAGSGGRAFHYADSVYFQDGLWLTILLTGALYIVLAAALDAAGYMEGLAIVVPVTIGAFAVGLLMSYSRFDGFFALSYSMFVSLAWILFLMARSVPEQEITPFLGSGINELQARVYLVLLRLLDWVEAALNGAASADNYVFMFEISFLMWWLTYLGVWSIFRYGYTWRAIVPAGVVLLINTYYAPRSTIPFLIVFVLLALILLIRTNLAEQQLRWREQRVYFSPDITWDFVRNGLLFSALLVAAAWVLPGLGRNPQVREFLAPVNSSWEQTAQNVQRLYQGLNRQAAEQGSAFGDTLPLGGARNVTDEPVFQAQTSEGRYWRAVAFDTYDGRTWSITGAQDAAYEAGQIVPVASWRARKAISQTITLLAPVGDVLFGMPDMAQATLRIRAQEYRQPGAPPIQAANPAPDALAVEFALARTARDLNHGDAYTVISAATTATQRDLRGAGTDYPPAIADRYLQIPPNFSPRVADLARQMTAGATNPYDQAKAIENFLRTIPYNDSIPATPADADPLEYFLFDIQQGYCDYYATAMTMMLRSVGVPARAVSGYAEGIYDEENGLYFVTQRDAHTWVEVFFPEYGWIEFEPTAAESPLERPTGDEAEDMAITSQTEPTPPAGAEPTPEPGPDAEREPPPFTGEELLGDELGGLAGRPSNAWWLVALALLIVVPVGGFLIWRARHQGPTTFAMALPLVLYVKMQQWAQRLGIVAPPSATPYEHAATLVQALPQGRPQIGDITESYVRFRFSRQESPAPEADPALQENWRTLEGHFWRAWWRNLRTGLWRRSAPAQDHFEIVETPRPAKRGRKKQG